ncbi:MAG: TetR/AcrR family transcriptional regulator [Acidimicrobiia bacterium]|nr:TetR/AcrR family transcriptional regulator [Acidimicrobiia bacterium]
MTGPSTRDKLIDAAIGLLHVHAYPAVGVQAICDAAGVLKGSFYHFFDSKEDLAVAAVERAWDEYRSAVVEPAIAAGTPSAPRPDQPCVPPDHACLFSRLAAGVTEAEPRLRGLLGDVFRDWADLLGDGTPDWASLASIQGRLVIAFAVPEEQPA